MKENDFIERTLLSLRREYSKDEVVAALNKKIRDIEFENGLLKSEVSEIEYLRSENLKIKKDLKHSNTQLKQLRDSNQKKLGLTREIKELRIYIQHLESKH